MTADEKQAGQIWAIQDIVRRYNQPHLMISNAYGDGGLEPLWPRLERAAMNHLDGAPATPGRYGIWANTVRDILIEAIRQLDRSDLSAARNGMVRAANSLSAFSDVQALLDPRGDDTPAHR